MPACSTAAVWHSWQVLLGVVTVDAYVVVVMIIIFNIIKKTIGLRVTEKEEIDGLDIHEHGLTSAYSGFSISDPTYADMREREHRPG